MISDHLEKVDIGYDTDRIADFEIDKSFTDYLLCQTCCSKLKINRSETIFRVSKRPKRM